MTIRSFLPPTRTLMGPGPSDVHPRVLLAMARPTIGHMDPEFIRMMDEIKKLLQHAFRTKNEMTMVASGPGSAGMETCFVNLVEPGDKVVVCQNGVFGGRMKENVERCGGIPIMVEGEWGRAVDLDQGRRRIEEESGCTVSRVRSRGNLDGRALRCPEARPGGACARLPGDRRCRDVARGSPARCRRMEGRRRLFRQPEMSFVHARPLAGQLQRARDGDRSETQEESAELVPGSQPCGAVLGKRGAARLPPHGPHQCALRVPRSASHPSGRRPGERLGTPLPEPPHAPGRPGGTRD